MSGTTRWPLGEYVLNAHFTFATFCVATAAICSYHNDQQAASAILQYLQTLQLCDDKILKKAKQDVQLSSHTIISCKDSGPAQRLRLQTRMSVGRASHGPHREFMGPICREIMEAYDWQKEARRLLQRGQDQFKIMDIDESDVRAFRDLLGNLFD